ncbi:retrovirus-related pol polyprotein from transposon TNT 1-94 [Tanacetum coccineum]
MNATVRNVRTDNGTEFVNQTLRDYYENVRITHETSVARTPKQKGVVKRQNQTLVEAARTMLIFSKAPLFLWVESISIACYTQNRSLIRLRYNKTPYELMHDKKPDLSFLHVFGSLCYPTNDSEDLGKLKAKADIDLLFQPIFDEFFNPPPSVVSPVLVASALRHVNSAGSPSSTSIDQDTPSASNSSSQETEQSPIISQGVEEQIPYAQFDHTLVQNILNQDTSSQESSSNVQLSHTPFELLGKWTKNHPLANVIGDPSRSAFLTLVEPKNFKEEMTEPSWINAM